MKGILKMIRTFFIYIYLIFFLIGTNFTMLRVKLMRKNELDSEIERYISDKVSYWTRRFLKTIGVTVEVIGNENLPEGNCLFVSNHQGNIDFFAILGYINKAMGFIAKKEIIKIPILRYWMKQIHCVFMNRQNIRESVKAIEEGIDNLKNGYSMVIFPEGTRSKGIKMGEFKKGSLKLGTRVDIPIVPITVDGSYKIFEDNNGKKILPGKIKLIIDKPIYAKDFSSEEQKNISVYIQNIIQKNLDEIHENEK